MIAIVVSTAVSHQQHMVETDKARNADVTIIARQSHVLAGNCRKFLEANTLENESSRERKFQGVNWPGSYWNFRSWERIGPGAKRPGTIVTRENRFLDYRKWCNLRHIFSFNCSTKQLINNCLSVYTWPNGLHRCMEERWIRWDFSVVRELSVKFWESIFGYCLVTSHSAIQFHILHQHHGCFLTE